MGHETHPPDRALEEDAVHEHRHGAHEPVGLALSDDHDDDNDD
jgi:hypothetical protein